MEAGGKESSLSQKHIASELWHALIDHTQGNTLAGELLIVAFLLVVLRLEIQFWSKGRLSRIEMLEGGKS